VLDLFENSLEVVLPRQCSEMFEARMTRLNRREVAIAYPTASSRGRRRWVYRFLSIVLVVTGQEACFRFMFPLPEVAAFNRVHYQLLAREDSRSWPIYKRGLVYDRLSFESTLDGFSQVHELNLYGFRGKDFSIDPQRGRRRALVIGDSVVEGEGASDSETIPTQLERLLREDGDDTEVINLGVVAASLDELTPLARDAIALLKPADLILVVSANDLPAPVYQAAFDEPAPSHQRRGGLWPVPRAIELLVRLAFGQPIYRRWPPHATVPFFLPVPDRTNPWSSMKHRPWELDAAVHQAMAAGNLNPWLWEQSNLIPKMLSHDFANGDGSPASYLRRIAGLCKAGNINLVIAYVPFCGVTSGRYTSSLVRMGMKQSVAEALPTDPIYRRQNEALARICREQNLSFADTTAALIKAESGGNPQYWMYDTHPRPAGYATTSRHIYAVWRRSAGSRKEN
jgi:lysophospholipase L1-like esterase